MRRFSVTIEKTVQVKQFEPVKVILTTESDCVFRDNAAFIAARDEAYSELKQKMNEIFGKPSSCLD